MTGSSAAKRRTWVAAALTVAAVATACVDQDPNATSGSPTSPIPPGAEQIDFYKGDANDFQSPTRMAVTGKGQMVVTDPRARIVASVNPITGLPDLAFRVAGKPTSAAVLKNRVFVGNADAGAVEEFDFNGHFRGTIGAGMIGYPQDVATDDVDRLVFVLDGYDRDVKLFEQDGSYLGTVVGPGFGATGLETPVALAVDPASQEVLVSDYGPDGGPAAIKRFSYSGEPIGMISGAGRCGMLGCSGGFSRPQGIAVDPLSGYLLVADAVLGEVLVLDRAGGTVVATFGSRDDPSRPLRLPIGVGVGEDGEVYVVSNRAARVMRFESSEVPR